MVPFYRKQPLLITISLLSNMAKYLGLTLDAKLRWKARVRKKREELGPKYKKMYWLMGRRSALSIHNTLMLYKQILTYVIQLWGCTKQSNTDTIRRFQTKVLRDIVDAPWYTRNADLHRALQMEMVTNEIGKFCKKHEEGFCTTSTSKRSSSSTRTNW